MTIKPDKFSASNFTIPFCEDNNNGYTHFIIMILRLWRLALDHTINMKGLKFET